MATIQRTRRLFLSAAGVAATAPLVLRGQALPSRTSLALARSATGAMARAALVPGQLTQEHVLRAVFALDLVSGELGEIGAWDALTQKVQAHLHGPLLVSVDHVRWVEEQFQRFTGVALPGGLAATKMVHADLKALKAGPIQGNFSALLEQMTERARLLPASTNPTEARNLRVQNACQQFNAMAAVLATVGAFWGLGAVATLGTCIPCDFAAVVFGIGSGLTWLVGAFLC